MKGLRPVLFAQTPVHYDKKPDRSDLITIITWHFQFHLVNVSILHWKYEYGARSKSRFVCYSHCNVTWFPLTTGTVASQCPSARGVALVTRYLIPLISAYLKPLKESYHNKMYSQLSANIIEGCNVAFDKIARISYERCRWLEWRMWWHALNFAEGT